MKKTCEYCRFYACKQTVYNDKEYGSTSRGECCINPPDVSSGFPRILGAQFCGKFKAHANDDGETKEYSMQNMVDFAEWYGSKRYHSEPVGSAAFAIENWLVELENNKQ